jgi:hypothetical protein
MMGAAFGARHARRQAAFCLPGLAIVSEMVLDSRLAITRLRGRRLPMAAARVDWYGCSGIGEFFEDHEDASCPPWK